MTVITEFDVLRITALSAIVLALLTWIVLRGVRGPLVNLWCVGGILGGLYSVTMSDLMPRTGESVLWWVTLSLSVVQLGIFAKWVALRLLREGHVPWRRLTPAWFFYSFMVGILLLLVDRADWAVRFVALFNATVVFAIAREAWLIARTQDNPAGFWLGGFLGIHGLLFALSGLVPIPEGSNPLIPSYQPASWAATGALFVIAAASNAFFIGLMLNRALRENESTQRALRIAETERLRTEERERLLADMHDGLGSQLATARLKVERSELPQEEVVELLRECMADLHLMVDTLREGSHSFADALADYRFRTERRFSDRAMQLTWSLSVESMPALQQRVLLELLRIIQEAINNAVRHARASRLTVSAVFDPVSGLAIEVTDDGVGLPEPLEVRRGVNNMHRRARAIGASLELGTPPGGAAGTRVRLHLTREELRPLQRSAA